MTIFSELTEASKFQARLLGLMYEDLLAFCLEAKGYKILAGKKEQIGDKPKRPVACIDGDKYIFDYLLQDKEQHLFLSESKCWPAYDKGAVTVAPKWIEKYIQKKENEKDTDKRKLRAFLTCDIQHCTCTVDGKPFTNLHGKILLWWNVLPDEARYWSGEGIEVLSIEELLEEGSAYPDFLDRVNAYKQWSDYLFDRVSEIAKVLFIFTFGFER